MSPLSLSFLICDLETITLAVAQSPLHMRPAASLSQCRSQDSTLGVHFHSSFLPSAPLLPAGPACPKFLSKPYQAGLFLTGIGSCKTLNILWEHPGAHVPMNLLPTGLHQNVCSRHKCLNDGVFQLHQIRFLSSFHWISFFVQFSLGHNLLVDRNLILPQGILQLEGKWVGLRKL